MKTEDVGQEGMEICLGSFQVPKLAVEPLVVVVSVVEAE
jgi:hypothetical protein